MKRYNDHLAKGIYTDYCEIKPATFGEVRSWIEHKCQEYYLDGPNDVDWIFRNNVLQQREEAIYVDFIENDGEYIWLSPSRYDNTLGSLSSLSLVPDVIKLVKALNDVGFASAGALSIIASKWRSIKTTDDFTWNQLRDLNFETLKELEENNLLHEQSNQIYSTIVNQWLFPLHSIEIKLINVDKNKLHEIQDNWSPY